MGRVTEAVRTILQTNLSPSRLEIIDESALHSGHSGHRPEGETHFRLVIESAAFVGLRPLARHRLVNELLKHELAHNIHALSLKLDAPGEP